MTKQQYERWKDFSRRIVNAVVGPRKRSPSRQSVRENIDFFFECRMEPDEWRRVKNWDHTATSPEHQRAPMCCSSHIYDLEEDFIPGYWGMRGSESAYDKARERYVDPVSCCIRAGLDVAVSPSAGVAGFTAGDIRAIYPEGIPEWVKDYFRAPYTLTEIHATTIDGIFAPGSKRIETRGFDELPDTEPVWL